MKVNNKIQISFSQPDYENSIASLKENENKYLKLIQCIEKITGSKELQTLQQIETFITDKTTFANILLSATLLNVSDEYAYIQHNHNKISLSVLEIQGDEVTTKKEILEQVREDATQYLSDEFISDYNILLKCANELNKLTNLNSSRFLSKSYEGIWSVNLSGLENSKHF